MGKILEAFANDNILTGSRYFDPDSEYGETMKTLWDAEKQLNEKLNDTEKELFHKFSEAKSKQLDLSDADRFTYGYRLGVLMTMEVFTESDDLLASSNA